MFKEMVSVITPTYNSEKFLEDTIKSVLNQTYKNFEMIIVDDCSSDNTLVIAKNYSDNDKRVKFYKLEENSGAAVARNKAIELAKGKYIAFLDSDDLWDSTKLEKQLRFMNAGNIGFSFTSYRFISESGVLLDKEVKIPISMNYKQLLKNTAIGCLTVIVDRNLVGDFRMPLVRAGQDTATWLSILRNGNNAYGYNETLASYRRVGGSISSNKLKALRRTWNTYRNIEKLSLISSYYYFSMYVFNAIKRRF